MEEREPKFLMSEAGVCVIPSEQFYVDILTREGELDRELRFNRFTTIVQSIVEDAS
jgi:hypothetical protein